MNKQCEKRETESNKERELARERAFYAWKILRIRNSNGQIINFCIQTQYKLNNIIL